MEAATVEATTVEASATVKAASKTSAVTAAKPATTVAASTTATGEGSHSGKTERHGRDAANEDSVSQHCSSPLQDARPARRATAVEIGNFRANASLAR